MYTYQRNSFMRSVNPTPSQFKKARFPVACRRKKGCPLSRNHGGGVSPRTARSYNLSHRWTGKSSWVVCVELGTWHVRALIQLHCGHGKNVYSKLKSKETHKCTCTDRMIIHFYFIFQFLHNFFSFNSIVD